MTLPIPDTLVLFDLDHTLLDGDSDDLWFHFLLRHGLVNAELMELNERLGQDYRDGRVSVETFSSFYAGLLGGHTPGFWSPWQDRFLIEEIRPRLPHAARELLARHRAAGHTLVLTTASNRVIAERTAIELGFEHLIATELEQRHGRFTGHLSGTPNMRDGKLKRLRTWLQQQSWPERLIEQAWFYSDSVNDLCLLSAVAHPVATNPDERLQQHAMANQWPVLHVFS